LLAAREELEGLGDLFDVAPIDVDTGTRTEIRVLEERYWSVFKPNAFDALASRLVATPSLAGCGKSPVSASLAQ
jgi:hypothetical protein